MNTLPLDLLKIIEYGLGGDTWQEFVDRYEEKYNSLEIDGFTFAPTKLDYTFAQLISSLGVATLPAYVDPESPGYETSLREIEGKTGNIPTQKKYYRLNRVTLRQQLQLIQRVGQAAITEQMQDVFMGLLDESTDGLLQSYYNSLTHQRHRIVSTGSFVIDTENNPRGLKGIEIKFGIPDSHFDTLATTKRWWTSDEHVTANEGADADPIGYIKTRVKAIRRTYHYLGKIRLELTQDLMDDLLTHKAVLTKIGYKLYPTSASDDIAYNVANNTNEDAQIECFRKLCHVDSIVTRDSYAYVDKPGKDEDGVPDIISTPIENFKGTNIALIPEGNIGDIQGVEPLTLGYDADKVASYDGGRLKLTQRAEPKTHSIYIESEAAEICVPSVPQYMFISTVTA